MTGEFCVIVDPYLRKDFRMMMMMIIKGRKISHNCGDDAAENKTKVLS